MTMTILCIGAVMVIVSGHRSKVEKNYTKAIKSTKISEKFISLPV